MGVFSSWETLAVKLRRVDSITAREEAMELKAAASMAISSSPSTGTRMENSPLEKLWVAASIS